MKNTLILICCLIPFLSHGQGEGRKQLEADRVGIYTQTLHLTTDEAKRFWPIFNEWQTENEANQKQLRELRQNTTQNFDKLTDAEIEKNLDLAIDLEQKVFEIRRKYMKQFKSAISIRKIVLIPKAEREFKKQLLHKLKDKLNDE